MAESVEDCVGMAMEKKDESKVLAKSVCFGLCC